MDFSFFTTDNKSGYKTRETWLIKNQPDLHHSIIDYCSKLSFELPFKEKIYFYYHKMKERPKCKTCNSEIKFRNRFDVPYGDFCSLICINSNKEEMIKRQKKTNQKKYGVDFYPLHNDFIKKQRKTKKEKYGDENFNNTEKMKKTKLFKYGDENFNNINKYKLTCLSKYGVDNYSTSNNYQNQINKKFMELYPNINFISIKKGEVEIKCDVCDSEITITKQLLYERSKRDYCVCTKCNPIGFSNRSGYEKEICDFLTEHNINCETNVKIKNKKTEIDIYLPEYKIGIEFNGLYWHNELFKDNNYHLNKSVDCLNEDIFLIHIFEDEWIYKKDIVKSIILNKLNLISNKIYARKCHINEVDMKTSKKFLEDNHIQGSVNSSVKLGLFYGDKLVSLMTFSRGRIIMGGKKSEWELNRFCNVLNTNVIGASSKLLNYFFKTYDSNKIISYSDIRYFDGKMYEKIGFKKISQSKPNYWYVRNDIRFHRFNYRKSILVKEGFDKNKTEKQIMNDRGIYRIYDCGNIRWEYSQIKK
jgi:hypothetical protein